jgi:YD repeat-containing protein
MVTQYDAAGRRQRVDQLINGQATGAWQFWAYPDRGDAIQNQTTIQQGADPYYSITVFDGADRVRAQGGDMPNSTGLFHGQFTLYDVMGRAKEQTNPAEINAYWVPAGDDAGGWISSTQTYDWKGRPRVRMNTDGTTSEATYGGCGCAGGEVVTLRDEVGRLQRSTSDVLGRTIKAEVLDANGNAYAMTVTSYNALDQATSVKQYQGADTSSIYQVTTMGYDGYGRLISRKLPQQTTATVYSYNADDQVQSVMDGRGAVASYSYNHRHLVTAVSYSAPSGITASSNVSYTYDETGNRTGMTDGMGSTSYHYDQLSRMDWEERTFTGLSQAFRLNYSYNFAGQLASLTDPFGVTVNYAHDASGRMTSISGTASGSSTTYASNMQYRAWGALKSLSYGNTRSLSVSYNTRLQATHMEVPGVMSSNYLYYADGRVSAASDNLDARFSRSYIYDLMGRLGHSMTAEEGPYDQSYEYDVWGNLTLRSSRHWSEYFGEAVSYVNNRSTNSTWHYDADGRLIQKGEQEFTFDASGQVVRMNNPLQRINANGYGLTLSYGYDGDGQKVKETKYSAYYYPQTTSTYYLHSSVLGGHVIRELTSIGVAGIGYVYMGSSLLMRGSEWVHENPITGSQRRTQDTGAIRAAGSVELDPLGTDVGMSDPYIGAQQDTDQPYPRFGEPVNQFGGCSVDGVPAPCSYAAGLVNMGAGVQVFTREMTGVRRNGQVLLLTATQYNYGLVPMGATPDGSGGYSFPHQGGPPVLRPSSIIPGLGRESRNPYGIGIDEGAEGLNRIVDGTPSRAHGGSQTPGSIWGNDWNKLRYQGVSLSPCAQRVLSDLFKGSKLNVEDLRVRVGIPQSILDFATITPDAVTIGNTIYLDAGAIDRFDARTLSGLANLAHEAWHALQSANNPGGVRGQIADYFRESGREWWRGKDPYWDNAFEIEAYQVQDIMKGYIKETYGDNPCEKLGLSPVAR